MKRIFGIVMIPLTLVACGTKTVYVETTQPEKPVEETVVVTDPPVKTTIKVTTPPVTDEDLFLDLVKTQYGGYVGVSDYTLLNIGYTMCDYLRQGGTVSSVSALIVNALPYDTESQLLAATITAAAVVYFCPEQGYKFQ